MKTYKLAAFDMDGTFVDLYGVDNWLEQLISHDPTPYRIAEPLLDMDRFARSLKRLQRDGFRLGIVSWLAKNSDADYDTAVTREKLAWLKKHLPGVKWDEIIITTFGNAKEQFAHTDRDILFDDEMKNRGSWTGIAYDAGDIIGVLG